MEHRCPVEKCDRNFKRLASLRSHLQQHVAVDLQTCKRNGNQCEYKTLQENDQQLNQKSNGNDDDEVQQLLMESQLKFGQRKMKGCLTQNRRTGKYECNECGKRFLKPSLLQRHSVVHNAEKSFQCDSCKQRFSQKSSLQRHYQEIHNRVKPHKCPKCGVCFSQKVNLLKHLQRTHPLLSTDKQFLCDRCNCVYRKLNSLNRHKSKQHLPREVSESMRYAQLAVAFQDATPVDDADELARNVLIELKKLQGVMLTEPDQEQKQGTDQEEQCIGAGDSNSADITKQTTISNNNNNSSNNETIIEASKTHLTQLVDKLNPQLEPHLITVQCIKRSDGIAYYICEFCSKEFRKKYNFIRHRRSHLHEAPYKCEHCKKCCVTKSKLETHRKIHRQRCKQYVCSICELRFRSIRELDMHITKLHSETHFLHYLCTKCSHSFGSLRAFSIHKHPQQDREYQMLLNLLPSPIHVSSNTDGISDKSDLKCATCGCLFSTRENLKLHYKIYATHKRYICGQCAGKSFPSPARLRRHMFTHTNKRNYKCVYCTKTYKTNELCKEHIRKHLKALLEDGTQVAPSTSSSNLFRNKEYLIVVWGKKQTTTTQESLENVSEFSESQMLPNCRRYKKRCSNSSIKSSSSLSTVPLVVDNVKSGHFCDYCKRIFKKPSDLQRHLRTHTKERPFVCELCGKSYALQSTLKEHQLTHNLKRDTFDCQVCGKGFSSKKGLVLHLRIHTGNRPFLCQYCHHTFRTSGHFKAHIKAAHK